MPASARSWPSRLPWLSTTPLWTTSRTSGATTQGDTPLSTSIQPRWQPTPRPCRRISSRHTKGPQHTGNMAARTSLQ
eukprot:1149839-Lingulodinium_polyedra.AAC.1